MTLSILALLPKLRLKNFLVSAFSSVPRRDRASRARLKFVASTADGRRAKRRQQDARPPTFGQTIRNLANGVTGFFTGWGFGWGSDPAAQRATGDVASTPPTKFLPDRRHVKRKRCPQKGKAVAGRQCSRGRLKRLRRRNRQCDKPSM